LIPPRSCPLTLSAQDSSNNGANIMLAGIILQLITMVSLALFYIWYFAKVGVWRSITLRGPTAKFNQLFIGTAICIVLVIIRGVYRTIELADGFDSPTAQNRACLDTCGALSDPF
jgi:hypothetical protein